MHSTKIDKHTISDPVKQKAVEKAEEDEVELILEGLKAVKIISESEVNRKTHRCHIFTMDKFSPTDNLIVQIAHCLAWK